jgi:hypothetical protein
MVTTTEGHGDVAIDPVTQKPYHSKRPHRKSRQGCRACKTRKVKCDEARPKCRNCMLRREDCVYAPTPPGSVRSPATDATSMPTSVDASPDLPLIPFDDSILDFDFGGPEEPGNWNLVVNEPLFSPVERDATDMKLLWFFTAKGYDAFSVQAGRDPDVDNILKVKIPQHAFAQPFLMDCLLALSALELGKTDPTIPAGRAIAYRARAFEGYRTAIEAARPDTFPALLACSLLLCCLSSQTFREPDSKELYIIDWMIVWRGIGLIVTIITPQSLYESGLAPLFYRPPIDLNTSSSNIPNNLLFMVSSIPQTDIDYEDKEAYYETLKYLGSLYLELQNGWSPILALRIITWFTFLPKRFIEVAQERRSRALVILAHYLCFIKFCESVWWLAGIANREIRGIRRFLGEEWDSLLAVPRSALYVDDPWTLGKLLMENLAWDKAAYETARKSEQDDKRVAKLMIVDDQGVPVNFAEGKFTRPSTGSPGAWNITGIKTEPTEAGESDVGAGLNTFDFAYSPLSSDTLSDLG